MAARVRNEDLFHGNEDLSHGRNNKYGRRKKSGKNLGEPRYVGQAFLRFDTQVEKLRNQIGENCQKEKQKWSTLRPSQLAKLIHPYN